MPAILPPYYSDVPAIVQFVGGSPSASGVVSPFQMRGTQPMSGSSGPNATMRPLSGSSGPNSMAPLSGSSGPNSGSPASPFPPPPSTGS